jgi:predicted MFS family arabinose efflux permease
LTNQPNKRFNNILRYSNIAAQMIAMIVGGTLGGKWLDKYLQLSFPVLTLCGALFSVLASVYITIKEFLKK